MIQKTCIYYINNSVKNSLLIVYYFYSCPPKICPGNSIMARITLYLLKPYYTYNITQNCPERFFTLYYLSGMITGMSLHELYQIAIGHWKYVRMVIIACLENQVKNHSKIENFVNNHKENFVILCSRNKNKKYLYV